MGVRRLGVQACLWPKATPLGGGSSSSSDSLSLAICTKLGESLAAFSTETPCGSLPFPFSQSLSKCAVTAHWPTDPSPPQKGPACVPSRCLLSPWQRAAQTSRITAQLCAARRGAGYPSVTLSSGPPVGKERDRGTQRRRGAQKAFSGCTHTSFFPGIYAMAGQLSSPLN